MLKPVKERADSVIEFRSDADLNFKTKRALDRWSWCDALFMAPLQYSSPEKIEKDMTEVYGVGAFLLAA